MKNTETERSKGMYSKLLGCDIDYKIGGKRMTNYEEVVEEKIIKILDKYPKALYTGARAVIPEGVAKEILSITINGTPLSEIIKRELKKKCTNCGKVVRKDETESMWCGDCEDALIADKENQDG